MRTILSRKGFDSANGRVASPIFPSGEMCSLPIPQPDPSRLTAPIHYSQIAYNGQSLASIVSGLTGGLAVSYILNDAWLPHQRLELENDLLATYVLHTGKVSATQFMD